MFGNSVKKEELKEEPKEDPMVRILELAKTKYPIGLAT